MLSMVQIMRIKLSLVLVGWRCMHQTHPKIDQRMVDWSHLFIGLPSALHLEMSLSFSRPFTFLFGRWIIRYLVRTFL